MQNGYLNTQIHDAPDLVQAPQIIKWKGGGRC